MQVLHGDCIDLMKKIPNASVNLVLCDLPYGTTACQWDAIIPFEQLWEQYWRILKSGGAILLFGSEPFSSLLRTSQIKYYKYDWVWEKSRGSNFVHSKYQPLKVHETISVFSQKPAAQNSKKNNMAYFPQFSDGKPYDKGIVQNDALTLSGQYKFFEGKNDSGKRFPRSVQYFSSDSDGEERGLHPTQKPVALLEYLIRTYTKEGEIVLDNTMGSGSTGIAAIRTKRDFIGIEKDDKYFEIAKKRIEDEQNQNSLF